MKRLMILLCLQGISLVLFGQNEYLQLSRLKNPQHIRKIPEGKMVCIKPVHSVAKLKIGRLKILNDSVIAAGKDTVSINNIKKIRARSTASDIVGAVVIAGSLGIFIEGIHMVTRFLPLAPEPYLALFETIGIIFGISVAAGGIVYLPVGIIIIIYGHGYKTYGRNGYSIKVAHYQTAVSTGGN